MPQRTPSQPAHNPKVAGSKPAPAIPPPLSRPTRTEHLKKPCNPADRDLRAVEPGGLRRERLGLDLVSILPGGPVYGYGMPRQLSVAANCCPKMGFDPLRGSPAGAVSGGLRPSGGSW